MGRTRKTGGWEVVIEVEEPPHSLADVSCRFSQAEEGTVVASRIRGNALACTAPALDVGVATVEVGYYGSAFVTVGEVTILPKVTVSSVEPAVGTAAGQQLVTARIPQFNHQRCAAKLGKINLDATN